MKKNQLKALIKPVVKECIQEVLLEEGLLSNVVSEVVKGMQQNLVVETRAPSRTVVREEPQQIQQQAQDTRRKLQEHRKSLMDSIGSDAYNGIDLFEGTTPMTQHEASTPKPGSIDLGDPKDSGVDISSIFGNAGKIWQAMK
tara:strand:+ start:582 stop:1007 length:426 start_codon:yes stop_codon:yes gene_type:complete